MDGKRYSCSSHYSAPYILGDLLGMDTLCHFIHSIDCNDRYIILYIYRLRHRINLEQQLANIKLRFFTDISHELRTPLTLIASPVTEVLEHETTLSAMHVNT